MLSRQPVNTSMDVESIGRKFIIAIHVPTEVWTLDTNNNHMKIIGYIIYYRLHSNIHLPCWYKPFFANGGVAIAQPLWIWHKICLTVSLHNGMTYACFETESFTPISLFVNNKQFQHPPKQKSTDTIMKTPLLLTVTLTTSDLCQLLYLASLNWFYMEIPRIECPLNYSIYAVVLE